MTSEPESTLTRRTLQGLQWTYVQTVVSTVLQLVVAGILARLLTPRAFGLVAIANLALRFVNYLARAGIAQAVVQKPVLRDLDVRAAFTASAALGLAFTSVAWVLAPVAATVFADASATPVIRVMGVTLILQGLGATAEGLLRRDLRFRAVAIRDIVSYVVGYAIVGIVAASAGAGVWALVAASLTQTGLLALLAYIAVRHSVVPTLDRVAHRALLAFGGRVSLISFFEFLGGELDTVAVGRYLGTSPLGLYNRGNLLARLPVQHLTTSLSRVLFPAFSSIQTEVSRVRAAYLSSLRIAGAMVLPITAGMAVSSNEIVRVVLGAQWTAVIPVLPFLMVTAALEMTSHFGGITAEARGVLNPKIAITTSRVVVLLGLLLLVADRGLPAFGLALALSALYLFVAYAWLGARVTEAPVGATLRQYVPGVVTAITVAAAILLVRWPLVHVGAPVAIILVADVATGAVCLLAMFARGPLRPIRHEVGDRLAVARMGTGSGRFSRLLRAALER